MRRIYLAIFVILCITFFYIGNRIGRGDKGYQDFAIKQLHKERAQLTEEIKAYEKEITRLKETAALEKKVIAMQDEVIKEKERAVILTKKYYEKEISKVRAYSISQLDSFFINRYPSPERDGRIDNPVEVESDEDSGRPHTEGSIRDFELTTREHHQRPTFWNQSPGPAHSDSGQYYFNAREGVQHAIATRAYLSEGSDPFRVDIQKIQTPAESGSRWRCSSGCRYFIKRERHRTLTEALDHLEQSRSHHPVSYHPSEMM